MIFVLIAIGLGLGAILGAGLVHQALWPLSLIIASPLAVVVGYLVTIDVLLPRYFRPSCVDRK